LTFIDVFAILYRVSYLYMKRLLIIGDSDGLIGVINPADPHHQRATAILSFLIQHQATLAFPTAIIAEAVTTFQRKYKNPLLAQQIVDEWKAGNLFSLPVDNTIMSLAVSLFNPHGYVGDTLFDAIVAAVATHHQADAIFSFDKWYTEQGLTLASELIEQGNGV
jgi:predicted nucleic acid-binding protein